MTTTTAKPMLKQRLERRMPSVKMTAMAHQNAESAARATVMAVTAENEMPILTTTQTQPLAKTHKLKALPVRVRHKKRRPSHAPTLTARQVLQHLLHQLQILAAETGQASTSANTSAQAAPAPESKSAAKAPSAGLPKVQAFELPIASLIQVAEGSGLQWVNSDPEKIAQVQAAIAAEPKPVHVPRERPPAVVLDEGPLVLVETRKDLSDMKLPF
jgi:hypothetical protein